MDLGFWIFGIWRFEMPSFAVFFTTALFAFAAVFLIEARSRVRATLARGLFSALLVGAFVVATYAAHWMVDRWWFGHAARGLVLDYPRLLFLVTPVSSLVVLTAARVFFHSLAWRFSLVLLVTTFAGANIVNWCNPGWCGSYGLPLRYSWWSDSITILNGMNLSAGTNWFSLALNCAGGLGLVVLLAREARKP